MWNVQSQNNCMLLTQRISKGKRRTIPTREDNLAGRSCSLHAQEAPGFRQGHHTRLENGLRPTVHRKSKLLPLLHCEAEPRGEMLLRAITPHWTRTRPSLPCFLLETGLGDSGILPTPGLLELVLHHRPDGTSKRLSNPQVKGWLAHRRCTLSHQTSLPPLRGRAGASGADQSRPTLPPPRRLVVVLPSCNNKSDNNREKHPNITTEQELHPCLPEYLPQFSSIHLFLTSIST